MSFSVKGQTCPICKAYLFEEDEIAVCPVCAAPHHRECFISAGKCGMEQFHGTDMQYDKVRDKTEVKEEPKESKEEMQECPSCHSKFPKGNTFCNQCGTPVNKDVRFIRIDFLGGVKPDEDLGEGVTANEAKDFVMVSTNRFIPKFKEFKNGAKVWFSFWHLLFPTASFAMRKMYSYAFLSGAVEIAASILLAPFNSTIGQLMTDSSVKTYYDLAQALIGSNDKAMWMNFMLGVIGVLFTATVRVLSALFANKLYYKHTVKTLKEIKETATDDEQKQQLIRKKGGVNMFAFIIAYMAVSFIPSIIFSFI